MYLDYFKCEVFCFKFNKLVNLQCKLVLLMQIISFVKKKKINKDKFQWPEREIGFTVILATTLSFFLKKKYFTSKFQLFLTIFVSSGKDLEFLVTLWGFVFK